MPSASPVLLRVRLRPLGNITAASMPFSSQARRPTPNSAIFHVAIQPSTSASSPRGAPCWPATAISSSTCIWHRARADALTPWASRKT
eukprot:4133423-Pyramimonas_sp.AAC.1